MTPLDQALQNMKSSGADAERLRFYERFADAELFLMLKSEADGEMINPDIFSLEHGSFALVFDLEERLARFAGRTVPYIAVSGRVLAQMLVGQGLGVGLNLGSEASEFLISPEAVSWIVKTLTHSPEVVADQPVDLYPPTGLPETLVTALDAKMATMAGRARFAYLCDVTYRSGAGNHLLAFVDAIPEAEEALAQAVSEVLAFSGVEAGVLDVMFFASYDEMAARLAKVGLRFDLPEPEVIERKPVPPGSDPDKPPILR